MPKGKAANPATDRRRLTSPKNGEEGGRPTTGEPNPKTYCLRCSESLFHAMKKAGVKQIRQILAEALSVSPDAKA